MKIKISDLLSAHGPALALADKPLSVKTSFALARQLRAIKTELETYDAERLKLCKRYGKLDEKSKRYVFEEEKQAEFEAAYNELVAQEVELPEDKLTLENEEIKLSANDLIALEALIEF